jgi:hypothetical protein
MIAFLWIEPKNALFFLLFYHKTFPSFSSNLSSLEVKQIELIIEETTIKKILFLWNDSKKDLFSFPFFNYKTFSFRLFQLQQIEWKLMKGMEND